MGQRSIWATHSWSFDFRSSKVVLIPWLARKKGFDCLIQFRINFDPLLHWTYKWLPLWVYIWAFNLVFECICKVVWLVSLHGDPVRENSCCNCTSTYNNLLNPVDELYHSLPAVDELHYVRLLVHRIICERAFSGAAHTKKRGLWARAYTVRKQLRYNNMLHWQT